MALEEKRIIDLLSWRPEYATIECRHADLILKDGMEVSRQYYRHVVGPKDDISNEEPEVQRLAQAFAAERAAAPEPPKEGEA